MNSVDIYAAYVADVAAASGGIGRTDTLLTNLAYLAEQAATFACVTPAALPAFDSLTNGVFFPADNPNFIAAHNANVAALRAALP